jgi:glycosyltransferase involved in cell wall biosynthesis
MTIANLSFSGAWGGLEMSSVKYTRLFHQAGYRSFEICLPGSPIEKALTEQGLEAKTVKARNYLSPKTTLTIRRWLREEKVEALFLHSMKDIWLVTPALAGMPHIKLFGFARMFFKDVNKKDPLHTLMYSRLNKMIALSKIQAGYLEKCLPVSHDKFIVIPNGVDIERFQPRARREDIRAQWGVKPEHVLFGLIGRLDKQKGSLEFVEAAAQVLKQQPNARFVLVGGNTMGEGDFDKLVHQRLKELGLTGNATGGTPVILTDFRKDIPDVMNALDVFCMPSYEENFGNVMLEAFASGLPCIGTNAGGCPEVLDGGETGLLAEPKSSESLAKSMLTLLAEPSYRQELGARARRKAVDVYDMKKIFSRVEALALGK